MGKRNLLISLVAGFCIAHGTLCFCHQESPAGNHEIQSATCANGPSIPSNTGSDDCGSCCGHLVFTAENPVETFDLPPQENFDIESLTSFNQLRLRSIYHPPKS